VALRRIPRERLEVVLVVEVLHLQREPFGDRTTSTNRLAFQPFRFGVAVAGDGPAVRTVGVRLIDAARVTVDAPMDAVLVCYSGRPCRVVLVGVGVLLEFRRLSNLRKVHRFDRLDRDIRAVRLAGLVVGDVVVAGVGDRRRVVLLEPLDGPLLYSVCVWPNRFSSTSSNTSANCSVSSSTVAWRFSVTSVVTSSLTTCGCPRSRRGQRIESGR